MKKFIVLYHSPAEAMAQMAEATEEQKAEGMKPWMAWAESMGEKLVDMGAPLMLGPRLKPGGNEEAATGDVTGYSIISASDLDEAKSLMKDHIHLQWHEGCTLDVLECMPM